MNRDIAPYSVNILAGLYGYENEAPVKFQKTMGKGAARQ